MKKKKRSIKQINTKISQGRVAVAQKSKKKINPTQKNDLVKSLKNEESESDSSLQAFQFTTEQIS